MSQLEPVPDQRESRGRLSKRSYLPFFRHAFHSEWRLQSMNTQVCTHAPQREKAEERRREEILLLTESRRLRREIPCRGNLERRSISDPRISVDPLSWVFSLLPFSLPPTTRHHDLTCMPGSSVHEKSVESSPTAPTSPELPRVDPRRTSDATTVNASPRESSDTKALSPRRMALKKTMLSGIMLVVVFWICALWYALSP